MTLDNYRFICANSLLFREGRPCEDCVGTGPWSGVRPRCYRGSLGASAAGAIAANRTFGTWHRMVLALSVFARKQFIRGGLPAHEIRVKQNFVSDPAPRQQPPSASGTVLYVGRPSGEEGIATVLEAWRALTAEALELVIVGDGPRRTELEQATPPKKVVFKGRAAPSEVRRLMLGRWSCHPYGTRDN